MSPKAPQNFHSIFCFYLIQKRKGPALSKVDFVLDLFPQSRMLRVCSSFEVELWTDWVLILVVFEELVAMFLSCSKHSVGQKCLVIIIPEQAMLDSN